MIISLTGANIPESLYPEIVQFNYDMFVPTKNAEEGYKIDASMPLDVIESFYRKNIDLTTILYDNEKNKVVGYFQWLLLDKSFSDRYKIHELTFKDMSTKVLLTREDVVNNRDFVLYVWSIGIDKNYRSKEIESLLTENIKNNGKLNNIKITQDVRNRSALKIMMCELLYAVLDYMKDGVSFCEILGKVLARKEYTFWTLLLVTTISTLKTKA